MSEVDALKNRLSSLVQNSSFVFLLGLAAGMAFGGGASRAEPALVPVLAVISLPQRL
jgi:hypothetical protein